MNWWKRFKSQVSGKVPTLNDLDLDSIGINSADGKVFIKKRTESGVESIVEIGGSGGSGAGATTFLELTDTPASYSGQAGKVLVVNSGENAMEFVSMSLVLDPATVTFDGVRTTLTAGEALSAGNLCYMTGGKMYKADADAVATSFCFAIATAAIDADSQGVFLLIGIISGFSSLTVGAPVFLSTTSGGLTQTLPSGSNDVVQVVGIALSATHVYFKPDLVQIELV